MAHTGRGCAPVCCGALQNIPECNWLHAVDTLEKRDRSRWREQPVPRFESRAAVSEPLKMTDDAREHAGRAKLLLSMIGWIVIAIVVAYASAMLYVDILRPRHLKPISFDAELWRDSGDFVRGRMCHDPALRSSLIGLDENEVRTRLGGSSADVTGSELSSFSARCETSLPYRVYVRGHDGLVVVCLRDGRVVDVYLPDR